MAFIILYNSLSSSQARVVLYRRQILGSNVGTQEVAEYQQSKYLSENISIVFPVQTIF